MKRTWKDFVTKGVSKLMAAALAITACLSGMTVPARGAGCGKDGVVREMTSQQLVEDMGLGYNIGNTFDSIGSFIQTTDPWEYQRGWGNEPVSKRFISKVKAAGFRTVRLPVSWAQWIDGNNHIDPGYMSAVQTVVDWCMEEDMYVILNIHHDSGAADTSWVRKAAVDWEWTSARYQAVWTQISENFKNYGDHLIFEGMNEVEFPAAPSLSKQYEILNNMNQLFVDTVRKTGGNNAARHLLIPGYNTNIVRTCDRRYRFPEDPAGHCILSIHYYSPSPFCVAEHNVDWAVPLTTWGSEEDIKAVEADLDMLAEKYITRGIPVIIGEYGVLTEDLKEKESIRRYVSKVPEIIMEYGMCPVLWDTSNAGDMKFIERVSGNFYDPVIEKNYAALAQKKASGQIAKRQFNFPNYKKVTAPASPNGVVSLASYDPNSILGISFTLKCTDSWDSYGGGGIVIEGLEKAIEYQFSSVFDEIVHIFTPQEKEKLKDQLTVAIWWTDESKGGNRREQISLENSQVTILYKGDGSTETARTTSFGGGGSSGGGGGSSSGGGGSRRLNSTTTAAGGNGNIPENDASYQYSMTEEQCNAHESTVYKLSELCAGGNYSYEPGDTVRITLSTYCNKGYGLAVGANVNGKFADKQADRKNPTITWEIAPDTGEISIIPYWMEKNAGGILYNLQAEVIKKAPRIQGFDVADLPVSTSAGGNGENPVYEYSLDDAYEIYQIEKGKRVKLTIHADEPEDETAGNVSGEVWFTDVNGARVSWNLGRGDDGGYTTEAILVGTPADGKLMFCENQASGARQSSRAAISTIHVNNIQVEQLPDEKLAAEILGRGRVEFSSSLITSVEAKDTEPEGLKIYYSYDGDIKDGIGGQIVVNNDWDHAGSTNWVLGKDDGGSYIWYEGVAASSVVINCWSVAGNSWKITELVYVSASADEEKFEPFEVSEGADKTYSLKDIIEKAGIQDGEFSKITITVAPQDSIDGENPEKILTIQTRDGRGNEIEKYARGWDVKWGCEISIWGLFSNQNLTFNATDTCKITDIKAQKSDKGYMAVLEGTGEITIKDALKDVTDSKPSIRIYYEGEDEKVSEAFSFNGNGKDSAKWTIDSDSGCILYHNIVSESALTITNEWNGDGCIKITKIEAVEESADEPDDGATDIPSVISPGEEIAYSLQEKINEAGITGTDFSKVTVTIPKQENISESAKLTITVNDKKGNRIEQNVNDWNIKWGDYTVNLWGYFDNQTLTFKAEGDTYKISDIKVEKSETDYVGILEGLGNITINSALSEVTENKPSIKIFYEDGNKIETLQFDYKGADSGKWENVEGNPSYILYHNIKDDGYLNIASFNSSDACIKITGIEAVEDNTTGTMLTVLQLASASYTKAQIQTILSDADVHKESAAPDAEGLYHIPEDIAETLVGISGEVTSSKDVVFVFDEDENMAVSVKPVDGKVYYFLTDGESYGTVQFPEQTVKNVTFLYKAETKVELPEDKLSSKSTFAENLKSVKDAIAAGTDEKQNEEDSDEADVKDKSEKSDKADVKDESEKSDKADVKDESERSDEADVKDESERSDEAGVKDESEKSDEADVKDEAEKSDDSEQNEKAPEENVVEKENSEENTLEGEAETKMTEDKAEDDEVSETAKEKTEDFPDPQALREALEESTEEISGTNPVEDSADEEGGV